MKKLLFAFTMLVFCLVSANFAQEKPVENQFEFKGTVKDKNSAVFAGIPLFFKSNGQETFVSTDVNGEFSIKLLPGNYEITVRKTLSETFRGFIYIQENGLNPNNVEFIIEPNEICGASGEKSCPKIIKFIKPPYPAAARAIRAEGEVVVEVNIDKKGKVISANPLSGHPLLKAYSVTAAKQNLFEASENDDMRTVKLTYVYLQPQNDKKLPHYSNSYRIEIISYPLTIDTFVTKES
jgi:TonB family protein